MSKETCGSCTEPQVSRILSDRLSSNLIAWSKEEINRMTMSEVYTKKRGTVCSENIRIQVNEQAKSDYHEKGFTRYSAYAKRQSDEMLKVKHDWSLFEQECYNLGKFDCVYLLRKSVDALKPLLEIIF